MTQVIFALVFMMVGAFFGIIVAGLVSAGSNREESDRAQMEYLRQEKAKQDAKRAKKEELR